MTLLRLLSFGVYLGVGALFHAVFLGSQFDSSNLWSWALLVGWPAITTAAFFSLALLVALVILVLDATGVIS